MRRINRICMSFIVVTVVTALLLIPMVAMAKSGGAPLLGQRSTVSVPVGTSRSDLILLGRSAKIEGEVTGSVVAVAGDVYVTGTVGRDVVVIGGTAVLMPTAVVGNDVVVIGGTLQQAQGARVAGQKVSVQLPNITWPRWRYGVPFWLGRGFTLPWTFHWDLRVHQILRLVTSLILGWLVLALLPGNIDHMAGVLESNWVRFMLLGFASYLVAIVVIILVGLTIIGLPLALLLALGLAVARLLAQVTVSVFVGQWFLRRLLAHEAGHPAALFAGLFILFGLSLIPVVNVIAGMLAALVGLGVVVDTRFGSGRPWFPPRVL